MPDPSTNKVYRLQIGAFSTRDAANNAAQSVSSLGFQTAVEQSGQLYRVLALNVPAATVQYAAQRLASTGIKEIWVRE
jgi:cell division septation protein DedD